ncbi:ABC transporter substrate-binding protein [Actinomadura rubrisoli]|uniref:ABC transporter substrate-binding protein n=1 Tax=Actinomadura rubrisoli TaxID=2530368 RepID=A0A4R5C4N9_9ACTN|nr:ABC transporter substrate-binding protein [Actinomadura rubrisoli]TDD93579.1 ABC transporter substrate-binding protein [Actinomadura rubrisoli]
MIIGSLRRRAIAASALVLTGALALSACGEKKESTEPTASITPKSGPDQKLVALVPAEIKSDGVVKVGSDTTYAPAEFLENNKAIGFDIDLFDAAAAKLGLKTQWITTPFTGVITGVKSGKYEAGISSLTINPERLKDTEMVSYFNSPIQWVVKKGNPQGVQPDNACGKKVAVQTGTVEVDDLKVKDAACKKGGKPGIKIDQFQDQSTATAAVVSGKDDAGSADYPVFVDAVDKAKGQLELLGEPYGQTPYGVALKKGQTQFAEAVAGAYKAIIADGTYKQILDKWKVSKGAITDPAVNPKAS